MSTMDAHVKAGTVYLQPRKNGKKWKQVWLSLYPASVRSVGRLEISDISWAGGGAGGESSSTVLGGETRRHQPCKDRKVKVVRLSDVISVLKLPPHAEALPKDNMSAFCVEMEERNLVFAANKNEGADWVEKVCEIALQSGSVCDTTSKLQMEENQIYVSTEEAAEFSVVVQQTQAAARCGLQGAYWLQVAQDGLILKEVEKRRTIWGWPYRLLRRYGKQKLTLYVEAGRRCDSGPGTFMFETGQVGLLFDLIENAIKQQKANDESTGDIPAITTGFQSQEGERGALPGRLPHSPLPKIPDIISIPTVLENNLKIRANTSTDLNESRFTRPADPIGQSECVYSQPADQIGCAYAQPGPSEYMHAKPGDIILSANASVSASSLPLPAIPAHQNLSAKQVGSRDWSVSNPVLGVTSVYVDPASVLPLKPPSFPSPIEPKGPPLPQSFTRSSSSDCANKSEPIYSEVYDKLSPKQRKPNALENKKGDIGEEPIYTEPVREAEGTLKNDDDPDLFAHLYARVCKQTPPSENAIPLSSSSVTDGTAMLITRDEDFSDVIYETLGII